MKQREVNIYVPMVDLMTCTLMTVFVLFIAALAEVRPEAPPKKPTIDTDGVFAIVLKWPEDSDDDIDLYVMDPERRIVYFSNPRTALMHLERDDRGRGTDTAKTAAGATIVATKNEERTIIRGIIPGEYAVNVHVFSKRDRGRQTPVIVSLYRLDAADAALVRRELILERGGEEQTAFRMTIDGDEQITEVNELPRPMIGQADSPDYSPGGTP